MSTSQAWPRRARFGQIVVAPTAPLVVVAPHPDDEVLSFGGAICEYARLGGHLTVIAVTDGEAADNCADRAGRRLLAVRRCAERRAALRCLNAEGSDIIRLRAPDGQVADQEGIVARRLCSIFTRIVQDSSKVPTIVSPWRFDRHPDHEAVGRATMDAIAGLKLRLLEVPIWAAYEVRRRDPRFGGTGSVVIGNEARRAKRAALQCFSSQLDSLPHGRGPVLPPDFLAAFDRPFEPVLG